MMIRATDLVKRFTPDSPPAVDGLSFDVNPGEIVGFVGENGAGKTTTLRMLIGLLRPSGGQASICGHDCQREPLQVRKVTSFSADEPYLYDYLTPLEHVRFLCELRGLPVPETLAYARELLGELGLAPGLFDAPTVQLSLGNKKKVVLTLALCPRPQVLLLDEPTNALDPEVARRFRQLLDRFAAAGGAVLLSTHLLDMAERLCHRVLMVQRGRKVAMGTVHELRQRCGVADSATLEDLFFALMK